MPVYDYECQSCGVFTERRPMSDYALPMACPDCGSPAPRAFLVAPALASMDAGRRVAFATNERSAHAPKLSSNHGAGCSCCSQKKLKLPSKTRTAADGAKSFPAARPWMISH